MTAALEVKKDEKEWLEARRSAITSTDAAVIAGVGYISPLELWMQKTGRLESTPDSRRFRFGRWAEDYIAEELRGELGLTLEKMPKFSFMRSKEAPARIASLDLAVMGDDFGTKMSSFAECKTLSARLANRWENGPADYAFVQVQHALYVTGFDAAWIACLVGAGEDFLTFKVEPSPDFIGELLEREHAFEECVRTDTPPAAIGTEADKAALSKLYPKDSGETVVLDSEVWAEMFGEYRHSKEAIKLHEELVLRHETALKEAMKGASYAEIPGVAKFSWKTQTREMKPTEARTITTRVFREVKV